MCSSGGLYLAGAITLLPCPLMPLKNLLAATLLLAATAATAQNRHEYLLDSKWKFSKGDVLNAAKPDFADAKWQTVSVPHDWAIAGPFDGNNDLQVVKIEQNNEKAASQKSGRTGGLPFIGTGWYRRRLTVPSFGPGQRAVLLFDGAMLRPMPVLSAVWRSRRVWKSRKIF